MPPYLFAIQVPKYLNQHKRCFGECIRLVLENDFGM